MAETQEASLGLLGIPETAAGQSLEASCVPAVFACRTIPAKHKCHACMARCIQAGLGF